MLISFILINEMIYFFYILIYNALVEKSIYLLTYPLATSFFYDGPRHFGSTKGTISNTLVLKKSLFTKNCFILCIWLQINTIFAKLISKFYCTDLFFIPNGLYWSQLVKLYKKEKKKSNNIYFNVMNENFTIFVIPFIEVLVTLIYKVCAPPYLVFSGWHKII